MKLWQQEAFLDADIDVIAGMSRYVECECRNERE